MKHTFASKSFASKTFASGNWTGVGVEAVAIYPGDATFSREGVGAVSVSRAGPAASTFSRSGVGAVTIGRKTS